jgi:protoporphyrinogen oxidase
VIAVQGDAVLSIGGVPDLLCEQDRRFFQDCRYQRIVSVAVRTDVPVDGGCYAVSIPRVEKMSAATISFIDYIDASRVPEGEGLCVVSGGGPDVTAPQLLSDFGRLYKVQPKSTEISEWKSGMPKFPPGRYRQIAAFKDRSRRPGLIFCGDYLMGPFLEAAVTTGVGAAEEVR